MSDEKLRVLAFVWLPLAQVAFCLSCEAIFRLGEPACVRCGSEQWLALQRWLGSTMEVTR